MAKTKISNEQEKEIVIDYIENNMGIYPICEKYHIGKIKLKEILQKNNITLNKKGKQPLKIEFKVKDYKEKKYINTNEYYYIVKDLTSDFVSKDLYNKGGILTTYIHNKYKIDIPTLYERRIYYMTTGDYWWEQYLVYEKIDNQNVKHCPFCDWSTIDLDNKSGMFETHLLKKHNISKIDYLKLYPEDRNYFYGVNPLVNLQLEDNDDNFVTCKMCGKKLTKISNAHLKLHNMTKEEYILKFGKEDIMCKSTYDKFKQCALKANSTLTDNMIDRYTSKAEKEIIQFLNEHGVSDCHKNRSILKGNELDIYIPSKGIAIEYNGNLWHSEKFGKKDRNYHLNKLKLCNEQGIKLIQICDDEYIEHKDIVLNKISHLVGIDVYKNKIYARKTVVKQIFKFVADDFLNNFHIQGTAKATIYLGCFYQDKLIGVMAFKNGSIKNNGWELTRFATDYNYICCGVGSKMFNYFLKNYKPQTVFSFADRRWTVSIEDNIYTKMGFKLDTILRPDYKYYLPKGGKNKRIHKMSLNKKTLSKKYNLDIRLTETEMTNLLGYDRIWDCGLIKYVYTNPNYDTIYK